MSKDVAFIGLGAMGRGMAANLQRKLAEEGQVLHVFNRTVAKAEEFAAEHGCTVKKTLPEMRDACSLLFMMLADDTACTSVLDQLCSSSGTSADSAPSSGADAARAPSSSSSSSHKPLHGKVVVNHSTVTPDFTRAAAQQVAAAGGTYLNVPVFGRPDAAAGARLLVVASGPSASVQQCTPYFQAYGRVLFVGEDVVKASALKLCGNFMIFSMVDMLSEAFTLADKNGVARGDLLEVINGFFPAPSIQGYAKRIAGSEFDATAGATVELALKDVRYMRQLADSSHMPLPMADVVFGHLLSAAANGHGSKDVGALVLAVQQAAGLQQPPADK